MDIGIIESLGILAAISAGLAGPVAIVRYCASAMDKKVSDSASSMNITITNQTHKMNNVAQRMDIIERAQSSNVERIVKLETNLSNLEKGQERIEHLLDKMEADAATGRAEIIESIREISRRELKP